MFACLRLLSALTTSACYSGNVATVGRDLDKVLATDPQYWSKVKIRGENSHMSEFASLEQVKRHNTTVSAMDNELLDSRVHFSDASDPWSSSRHVAVLQSLDAVEQVRLVSAIVRYIA